MEATKRMNSWTDEQRRAIEEGDCNLLVAAAAGAGKTAVLVERIIRKVTRSENPLDIDRLLVVTFTNAAAAEMRERIGEALSKVLEGAQKSPGSDIRNLQRQLALLGRASITTIHSFCLEVIRNNFHLIDLDPGFRISEETESALLKLEALEELVEARYEPENLSEEFLSLVECYGGNRDDKKLIDIILTLYEFVQSHPWPEQWLYEASEAFNAPAGMDFGSTKWAKVLMKSIAIELTGLKGALGEALELTGKAVGLEKYPIVIQEDLSRVSAMQKACNSEEQSWDALYDSFRDLEFSTLPRCGKDADQAAKEKVKAIRDEVKTKLKKIRDELVNANSGEMAEDLKYLYPIMKELCRLVIELDERYAQKKKEKGIIDFNDLEHFCLKILACRDEEGGIHPTGTALELQERFEEIYIDEYQDSNLTQEVILNIISREEKGSPNIFMVGDVKQSIYKFRQAKPELFLNKYNTYSEDTTGKYRKILLYKNFRSREDIINGVNFIFRQIMSETIGDISYTEREALNRGAEYPPYEGEASACGGPVELHIVETKEEEKPDEDNDSPVYTEDENEGSPLQPEEDDKPDAIQSEAMVVAERIKELVGSSECGFMVFDKGSGGYRPVRYSDIVILLRTTKNWADVFAEELNLQGIPVYTDSGSGYFKTVEISTMLSLLQIIDNPMQDIPMLAVLRSPVADFSPEELIEIRLSDREASFFEAMEKAALAGDDLGRKTNGFLQRLDKWRQKSLYLSTDELIWYLYSDTGYYSFAGAMPGGIKRQANLRVLFDRARQYEESSFKGLFNFINFINKLKGSQGDMGSAKTLGEKDDVVRIMSIHKSKGLEFPIVFVCGTGKGFNLMDTRESILLHHDLGIGPDFVDHVKRIWYPSVFKQALKYKIKLESLSEEMRILYVAFTRAKEKLIITGSVSDIGRSVSKWESGSGRSGDKVQEYNILKGKCYLDWICTALCRHPAGLFAEQEMEQFPDSASGEENSKWQIKFWNRGDMLRDKSEAAEEDSKILGELQGMEENSGARNDILKRLEWQYPYAAAENLPVKLTVTELKRYFDTEYSEEYYSGIDDSSMSTAGLNMNKRPRFLEGNAAMTAAEKGSIMHFAMQHLDFKLPADKDGIRKQIDEMVLRELMTEAQAQAVNTNKIYNFLCSGLGKRMASAEKLNREVPFNIELKCTEVFKDLLSGRYEDETVVLQGIIDCYFEENGGLVLVDYKTDYVPEGGTEQVKEKYATQLEYYARALEKITGKKVKEKYIYLFWNGEVVSL
ncbi:MAG: helicase-exonuclease AddAB subunit AddA [Caulobacteraceae bacterium]